MISRIFAKPALVFSAACVTDTAVDKNNCVCKPSELPIYTKNPIPQQSCEVCIPQPGMLETSVGSIRRNISKVVNELNQLSAHGQDVLQQGLNGTDEFITYLRKEENVTPKYGAIVIGGFTGFIFAARGKMLKKLLYTSTGALTMTALCYPKEASKYANIAYGYATVAINFICGVKKDDPSLELPLFRKFPTSINDAWDKIKKFNSNVTDQAATPTPEKQRKDMVITE